MSSLSALEGGPRSRAGELVFGHKRPQTMLKLQEFRNHVIRELFRIVCQFPGGLSGAVIKGELEQVGPCRYVDLETLADLVSVL